MAGLLFVQLNVGELFPVKFTTTGSPPHTATLAGWLTVLEGLTVMLKVCAAPAQEPIWGVTVMVAVSVAATLAVVKFKSPLPLAAKPMAGLLFVQANAAPAVPLKVTVVATPPQRVWLAGALIVGAGLIVMVNVCAVPGQAPILGVTVMVAVSVVPGAALVKLILPLPEAPRPMAVLLFVQLNVAPAVPLKLTETAAPPQTVWSAGSLSAGVGFTVMVKVRGIPGQVPFWGVTVIVAV